MEKQINLNHGLPQSPYFLIAQPKKDWGFARTEGEPTIVILNSPNSNEVVKAEFIDKYTMDKNEHIRSRGLCLVAYGCEPQYLRDHIHIKDPSLKDDFEIEYWLLKKI